MAEYTEEEAQAHVALCRKIDAALVGSTYDQAMMALTSVTARLCAECDCPAEMCLTLCEDLLAEFRVRMEQAPAPDRASTPPDRN